MIELRIECFHRVLPAEARTTQWPYFARGTAMTIEEFDDRLANLSRHYEIIDEVQVAKLLDGEASPIRACWVTFDDGYADVLDHAADVVAKYGVRPSIFMTTRVLDGDWWPPVDRWYSALCQTTQQMVRLSHNGISERWDLGTAEGRARAVVCELKSVYLESNAVQQAAIFKMLCDSLEVKEVVHDMPPFLTKGDLVELSSRGWYAGPHGHRHRLLPRLTPEQLEAEVMCSVDTLEGLPLQNRSSWFAYSDGRHDQSVRHQVSRLLSSRGYRGALTIGGRMATGKDSLWSTPRFIA